VFLKDKLVSAADLVGMRVVAAAGGHSVFIESVVEFRVVREKNGGVFHGGFGAVFRRVDVSGNF
jgi:hypothetical protein